MGIKCRLVPGIARSIEEAFAAVCGEAGSFYSIYVYFRFLKLALGRQKEPVRPDQGRDEQSQDDHELYPLWSSQQR
jgi:hypothetical protein